MREGPDVRKKRIDLNVPQVAGGAVAAVVAAKLASYFGVYGTILGAGLVSVIATCGGSVFQHFFRRTGEQIREAKVAPKALEEEAPPPAGEFTEGTVYRARVRSWKRPVVAAALVFGVTMAGITTYELVSGASFSGGTGTTVSGAVTGRDSTSSKSGESSKSDDDTPTSTGSGTPSATADDATPSSSATSSGGTTSSATPTPSASDGSGTPTPTPSASATTPTPAASSRSGSADQDQADPAAR